MNSQSCGYTINVPLSSLNQFPTSEWRSDGTKLICQRSPWAGSVHDHCIWHAKESNKHSKDLLKARKSEPERLDGAYLPGISLSEFSFRGCSLRRARFDHSQLTSVEFQLSDLQHTSFRNADLIEVNFFGAEVVQSEFTETEIIDATLRGSNFEGSDFIDARFVAVVSGGANFKDVNCHNADFRYVEFDRTILHRTNFLGSTFDWCGFDGTKFIGLNQFSQTQFDKCEFSNCDLSNQRLPSVEMTGCKFKKVNLTETQLDQSNLQRSEFKQVTLEGISLKGSDLRGVRLPASVPDSAILDNVNLQKTNLRRQTFSGVSMKDADFRGANLWNADLNDCDLRKTDFSGSNVSNVNLTDANCSKADFTDATLLNSDLTNTDFGQAIMLRTVFELATLNRSRFWRTNLTQASFFEVEVEDTVWFQNSDLTGANLQKATFDNCEFEGATLRDSDARDASFRGANMEHTAMGNMSLQGANLQGSEYFGATFENARINTETVLVGNHLPYEDENFVYNSDRTIIGQLSQRVSRQKLEPTTNFREARAIYGSLEELAKVNDLPERVRFYYLRKKDLRRQNKEFPGRLWNEFSWAVTEYVDNPLRIIGSSLFLIAVFSVIYPLAGLANSMNESTIRFAFPGNISATFESLYFSTVTFTSVGSSEWYPSGPWAELFVGIESLLGAVMLALLVFVLGRRATR